MHDATLRDWDEARLWTRRGDLGDTARLRARPVMHKIARLHRKSPHRDLGVGPSTLADDQAIASSVAHVRHHYGAPCCGPCGCLHISYVYHRELRSTYGLSFDPRNFDQTEPYYHFGRVRAYPRYWVDAEPVE